MRHLVVYDFESEDSWGKTKTDTIVREYESAEKALEEIRYIKAPFMKNNKNVRLFEITEVDVTGIEGYTMDQIRAAADNNEQNEDVE